MVLIKTDPRVICFPPCLKITGHFNSPHYNENKSTRHSGTPFCVCMRARVYVCVCVYVHMLQCLCGGKRATFRSQLFSFLYMGASAHTHQHLDPLSDLWPKIHACSPSVPAQESLKLKAYLVYVTNPVSKGNRPNQRKYISRTTAIEVKRIHF